MTEIHYTLAISGASGMPYAVRCLELLQRSQATTHLVISKAARTVLTHETAYTIADLEEMADHSYAPDDFTACLASGSFKIDGMLVAPCSVKSLSEIAYGMTSSLLTRAADVTLKERRKLVLMLRETPLHAGHLKAMLQATESGAIIMPPCPAFYTRPDSIETLIDQTAKHALELLGVPGIDRKRWSPPSAP